jgi:hypothetical protein
MMLMPANNTSGIVHYLAGAYPNKIGLFISPDGWRVPPWYLPYALDNGCFIEWKEKEFYKMCRQANFYHAPLFVVVPDVVADAEATMKSWHIHKPRIADMGYKLGFACQDGMEPQDVPKDAHCCFIGGSTEWKLSDAHKFKGVAPWLHIGRVNTPDRLKWAENIGADSVDGTGFFRSKDYKMAAFIEYFIKRQGVMFS